jgi:hypothetical protein
MIDDDDDTERFLELRGRVDVARGALQDQHQLQPREMILAMLELVALKVRQDHTPADATHLFDKLATYQRLFFERVLEHEPVPQGKPS